MKSKGEAGEQPASPLFLTISPSRKTNGPCSPASDAAQNDFHSGSMMIHLPISPKTGVFRKPLTGKEPSDYLATGAWQGKAGAYGIQDFGDALVERIEGTLTNVVGLPMEPLTSMANE